MRFRIEGEFKTGLGASPILHSKVRQKLKKHLERICP